MFGSLKKLFSRPEPEVVEQKAQPAPPPAAKPPSRAEEPKPKPSIVAPPANQKTTDLISLPFDLVKTRFSPNLMGMVKNIPSQELSFQKSRILGALASGLVKVTFAEVKQAAPPGTFLETNGHDAEEVELPLAELLKVIPASSLPRRQGQSRVNPAAEVGDLFGPKGLILPQPVPGEERARPEIVSKPAPAEKPAAMQPAVSPSLEKPLATTAPKPPLDLPAAGLPTPPVTSHRPDSAGLVANAVKEAPVVQDPVLEHRPAISFGSLPKVEPKPAAPTASVPISIGIPSGTLEIPLAQVSGLWPEAIKGEVSSHGSVQLPMERVEQTMKTGKVVFSYREVAGWIRPPLVSKLPDMATQSVEFPLSIVAPLFLAKNRQVKPQKKMEVGENIPNLFASGAGQAAATPEAPAQLTPLATPVPTIASQQAWGPQEVVQQSSILPGVVGALICSMDGLPVAAQLPGTLRKEIASAFLSQMFIRAAESARQLHAGELEQLVLQLGNAPWLVLKTPTSYFIAIGKAGEELPLKQLKQLAALLSSQPK